MVSYLESQLKLFKRNLANEKNHASIRISEIKNRKFNASLGPKYVVIDITNKCNLNCIACWTYSPMLNKKKPEEEWFRQQLPFETIKRLVEDLKELKTEEIRLTGGCEPFIHPQIMEIVKLIKSRGIRLDITTNFSLMNKKKLDTLVEYGVDNLTVSLWAATPKTYAKTHPNQTEEAFSRIKGNLMYFSTINRKTKVVIANVISNLNYKEIEKMIELAREVKASEVYLTMVDPIDGETDSLLLNKKQQEELKKSFARIYEKYHKGHYGDLKIDNPDNFLRRISNSTVTTGRYDSNIIYKVPCTVGWTFSRIMANGDVAPCCRGVMVATGNINRQRFRDIWNGQKQKMFRQIGVNLKEHPGFVEKVGCLKTCDNLMENKENYELVKNLD